jgi:hypothetical protein
MRKTITVSKVKKKAWVEFSKYIRTRDSITFSPDGENVVICYTCERTIPYKQAQAGHFQPGRYPIFLFDERQVHAQCYRCNINLKGNWPRYYEKMVNEYGKEEVEEMIAQRNNFKQWKVFELEEIYLKYKGKLMAERI